MNRDYRDEAEAIAHGILVMGLTAAGILAAFVIGWSCAGAVP